jgi:hypothetical protein
MRLAEDERSEVRSANRIIPEAQRSGISETMSEAHRDIPDAKRSMIIIISVHKQV